MSHKKITVEFEFKPNQLPQVGLDIDMEEEKWDDMLCEGIIELISMMETMYGKESVQRIRDTLNSH
jgi:hypothetical protein